MCIDGKRKHNGSIRRELYKENLVIVQILSLLSCDSYIFWKNSSSFHCMFGMIVYPSLSSEDSFESRVCHPGTSPFSVGEMLVGSRQSFVSW